MNPLHWITPLLHASRRAPGEIQWQGLIGRITHHWPEGDVRNQWDQLANRESVPFFQTPLWNATVWRHIRRRDRGQLRLITIQQDGSLVGIIPLSHHRSRGCTSIAPHISDYLEPLIQSETRTDIARLALRLLEDGHEGLTLHNVRANAACAAVWRAAAEAERWHFEQTINEQCPAITLPTTEDAWLATLSAHTRKELRRKIRKVMGSGNGRFEECSPAAAETAVDQLITLMQHRYQKAADVRRTLGPILQDAAPELIRRGRLRLSTLYVVGRPAACILESLTPDGPLLYNSGFDTTMKEWSPGLVAIALSIGRSISQGHSHYDFTRGDEPYKYDLGAENRPLLKLTLHPPIKR